MQKNQVLKYIDKRVKEGTKGADVIYTDVWGIYGENLTKCGRNGSES